MRCNACMSTTEFAGHACRPPDAACPVCADPLHESRAPYRALPCGHHMHAACFRGWAARSYACPVCAKSVGDMRVYWGMLDALLARDAAAAGCGEGGGGGGGGDGLGGGRGGGGLPPSLAGRTQAIHCNDCGAGSTAHFHFVYHKCAGCGGYNTRLA